MAAISGPGPALPPQDPRGAVPPLGQAIESYEKSLAHLNPINPDNLQPITPQELETIAKKTVELNQLVQTVMKAATPAFQPSTKKVAADLDKLLEAPINNEVSLLKASQDYMSDPANAELKDLIEVLRRNHFAFERMRDELHLLSGAIRNPNALGG